MDSMFGAEQVKSFCKTKRKIASDFTMKFTELKARDRERVLTFLDVALGQ